MELNIEVLQNNVWPSFDELKLTIPAPLQSAVDAFSMYYKNKNGSRKLEWLYGQGDVEIVTNGLSKKF